LRCGRGLSANGNAVLLAFLAPHSSSCAQGLRSTPKIVDTSGTTHPRLWVLSEPCRNAQRPEVWVMKKKQKRARRSTAVRFSQVVHRQKHARSTPETSKHVGFNVFKRRGRLRPPGDRVNRCAGSAGHSDLEIHPKTRARGHKSAPSRA
jgi:hypothetical protein